MNIRSKTLSVIAFCLLVTALTNFFVLKVLVFPAFLELEQQAAASNIQRVIEAINSEGEDVDKTLWDYSSWDDSYAYAKGEYPTYPDGNLAIETMRNLHLDIAEVHNAPGDVLFAAVFDRRQDSLRQVDWTLGSLNEGALLTIPDEAGRITGVIATPDGPALVAARPIVKTSGEGPPVGTFLFGRFLDEGLVDMIKDKIKVEFALTPVSALVEPAASAFRQLLDTGKAEFVEQKDDDQLIAYSLIRDFRGDPLLLVSAKVKRDISRIGENVLLASVGGVALTAILVMAVLAALLQWLLVGPLVTLTGRVVAIGAKGALDRRISLQRRDEIGILSREFDRMLANLADAHRRLVDHSYQSGIAHMASGVLHNLRNQLAPAMTRIERLREKATEVPAKQLNVALAEFAADGALAPAERKAKIATYIELSVQELRDRHHQLADGIAVLSRDLLRIEGVLGDLDRFSRVGGSNVQPISLSNCVRETIASVPSFPDAAIAINVDAEVEAQPPVAAEGFVLKHVLQNLIVNAAEAIVAAGKTAGTIDIGAATIERDNRTMVDLTIRDDGIGISAENLATIFKRGFSTKDGTRRGTGLHWCANSVSAMSGRIFAESAGLNRGTVFHVLLKSAVPSTPAVQDALS